MTSDAHLTEVEGDIFESPEYSVLIHGCNCRGAWGAGIALEFKKRYPGAYAVYNQGCREDGAANGRRLLGRCLLIAPQDRDPKKHWIACLMTSDHYGKRKDSKSSILENTLAAIEDLVSKIEEEKRSGKEIGALFSCRFNSGKFGVPWEDTKTVLGHVQALVLTVVNK